MRFISILTALLFTLSMQSFAQENTALAAELKRMATTDQDARNNMIALRGANDENSAEMKAIYAAITAIDTQHNGRLKQIIRQYGFPGFKLVGENASDDFWLLVQHQDLDTAFQKQVLVLMEKAVKANDASRSSYALLVDRVRINTGQKQLYGSQCRLNKDKTGFEPQPIEDATHVDVRRAEMELPPLDIYLQTMDDHYRMHLKR